MQTFLPLPSFHESAKCLDYRRLGKQRVEAKQLIKVVTAWEQDPTTKLAWINHPAAVMWRGYSSALKLYHDTMILEWIKRGYKNTMPLLHHDETMPKMPPWLIDGLLCATHRSNLLRKDYYYYNQFGWTDSPSLPYYWPK